jgi:Flp pilus assembly protein TadG
MTRRRGDEHGAIAIITAILATMLFIIAALVVDIGLARDTKRQSQNAADSSALAAGNVLYLTGASCTTAPCFNQAVQAAKDYALANFNVAPGAWAGCTDPGKLAYVQTGQTPCISFNNATAPTQVRVRIPTRTVDTSLGTLAGVDEIAVATVARAAMIPGGMLPCGLCVLGTGMTHDLQNGDVTVTNSSVHLNGNVAVSNNGLVVTNGQISVQGSASGPLANYTPDPTTGSPPIADPLAELVLPPAAMGTLVNRTDPCTQGAGIYVGKNFPNALCPLTPGLYVIRSGTWTLNGNANTILRGSGVTLYFTCSTGTAVRACNPNESGANLDFSGNGSLDIDGPTSGPLKGMSIIYDRNNIASLQLTGNGVSSTTGTIYAAKGTLDMRGNGCTNTSAAVVVHDLRFSGNPPCLSINYDQNLNFQPVPKGLHLDQ